MGADCGDKRNNGMGLTQYIEDPRPQAEDRYIKAKGSTYL